jgi:hypothetical protein
MPKKVIAAVAGYVARMKVKEWMLRNGAERWLAELMATAAGAAVSAAVMRT